MQPLLLRVGVPLAGVALVALAWTRYGWPGVAVVVTGIVMWALLHFNRLMQVLRRVAQRPIGYVDSAVMLNAKLRPGVSLLHVLALTRALGEQRSPKDQQPELYRWTDGSQSHVDCEFRSGRLVRWEMVRPAQDDDAALPQAPVAAQPGVLSSPP